MHKKHKCKEFHGTEKYFVGGNLILYIKNTGNSGGIKDITFVFCYTKELI